MRLYSIGLPPDAAPRAIHGEAARALGLHGQCDGFSRWSDGRCGRCRRVDTLYRCRYGCASGRGRQIAAIRELFEEAGILLATREGHELAHDSEYGPTLFERDRKRLNSGTITFLECVRTHRLVLNTTALQPFTRWITPEIETRRFDAHFFTTELPAQQTLFMTKKRRPAVNGFLRRQPSICIKPSRLFSPPRPAYST